MSRGAVCVMITAGGWGVMEAVVTHQSDKRLGTDLFGAVDSPDLTLIIHHAACLPLGQNLSVLVAWVLKLPAWLLSGRDLSMMAVSVMSSEVGTTCRVVALAMIIVDGLGHLALVVILSFQCRRAAHGGVVLLQVQTPPTLFLATSAAGMCPNAMAEGPKLLKGVSCKTTRTSQFKRDHLTPQGFGTVFLTGPKARDRKSVV